MADTKFTARRAIFALGIAIVTIGAPAAAAFAGSAPAVPHIMAGCTTTSEPGDNSLDCEPPAINEMGGAPSEMELTDTNPGSASPTDRGR